MPEDAPNDVVMSLRTTPLSVSTSGPFVPSPGNGPAVSSGITGAQASALVDDGADAAADDGRRRDGAGRAGGEERADPGQAHQLEHAAAIDERRDVGLEALVVQVERLGRGGLAAGSVGRHGWAPEGALDDHEARRTT